MVIKVIALFTLTLVLSCSGMLEKRTVDSCTVEDRPTGWHGSFKVDCPQVKFSLRYDNSPDGKDPFVLSIEGVQAKPLERKGVSYTKKTGDDELLSGWIYREVWLVDGHRLSATEYFVSGGTACYEEEEEYRLELELEGKKVTLVKFYQEDTDCGGN